MKPDAVVIGAGVDELVAAHYLARAGRVVTVVRTGAPLDAYAEAGWVPPRIVRDLKLDAQEVALKYPEPWASVPLAHGGTLALSRDVDASAQAIRSLSARDAERWPQFCERMHAYARVLETLYLQPPPDPLATGWRGWLHLAAAGLSVRTLGRREMAEFLRLVPMSVADLLDEWFESDALKGALGGAAVMNAFHGPRSGGTALALLHHHVGAPQGVFRPPLSNVRTALEGLGGIAIRTGEVVAIETRKGEITGVRLAGDEMLPAPLVVSGLPPARTLIELVDPSGFDPHLVRALTRVRSRGVTARIELVLDRRPDFANLVLAPSLDALERAYDDAKYGRASATPYVEARYVGEARGRHRVSVHVQYVPYTLRDSAWDTDSAARFGRSIVARIAEHAAGFADAIVEQHVLTPQDLEVLYGFPQGQPHHAELALDQALWMRPLPELARYRTPVRGLYLCGPAMHPGAGIAGAAGANAATVILKTERRDRRGP